jgi:hypothetical protein
MDPDGDIYMAARQVRRIHETREKMWLLKLAAAVLNPPSREAWLRTRVSTSANRRRQITPAAPLQLVNDPAHPRIRRIRRKKSELAASRWERTKSQSGLGQNG